MEKKYDSTIRACFTGYVVQAIINNFAPLLFITFQTQYKIPLIQITLLITLNFVIQLSVDLIAIFLIDKIGYRISALLAHGTAALGLIMLAILPDMLSNPFIGLLIAVICYAIGGGLLEVIISPIVESCPNDHKDRTMSMLHSFYCWGSVGVVMISTLFFSIFGVDHWRILALIWALLPIVNGIQFTKVPLGSLIEEGEEGLSLKGLLGKSTFWIFVLLILCAGASEQAVSQWSSTFAEQGLGISKTIGDLLGPTMFAVLMGISRVIYGKYGDKIDLKRMMLISGCMCIIAYLLLSLTSSPIIGFAGIAMSGFSVGILWPGTYSLASANIRGGGNAMFAILALAGDFGCASGPTFVGMVAGIAGDDLRKGILGAVIFPVILCLSILLITKKNKKDNLYRSLEES